MSPRGGTRNPALGADRTAGCNNPGVGSPASVARDGRSERDRRKEIHDQIVRSCRHAGG